MRKAFSLSEVLVVALIVGLLVSVFLPLLARATQKASDPVEMSNLHQLFVGWELYSQDHGGEPLHMKSFVRATDYPQRLLSSRLDPVEVGTYNATFTSIGPKLVPEKRWSHISRRDIEAVGLFDHTPGQRICDESDQLALAISPAGRVMPGEQKPPGFILFQEGAYFRLLTSGSVARRDIQRDYTQISGWVPDPKDPSKSTLCGGIDLLFFDPPKQAYLDDCSRPGLGS